MRRVRMAGAHGVELGVGARCRWARRAQGTLDDYRRAATVNQRLAGLTVNVAQIADVDRADAVLVSQVRQRRQRVRDRRCGDGAEERARSITRDWPPR